jgi:glyoxylase-like metal-dependent hydrolase (beta-lactamase superfamily II)
VKLSSIAAILFVSVVSLALGLAEATPSGEIEKISDNLYLYRDTANVYVIKSGDEAVLIDFGAGRVMEHLPEIGVNKVSWVLHTHYHRDQCQGDGVLAGLGVKVAVPAGQRRRFEDTAAVWKEEMWIGAYSSKPDFFEPTRSIKVDKSIEPGDSFELAGLRFDTLANIGPTEIPGLTYLAEIDGKRVAFTGDLIHSPGKVWNFHDFQWRYISWPGPRAAVDSLKAVKGAAPDLLLPSHGIVMDDPQAAIDETVANLSEAIDLIQMHKFKGKHPLAQGRIFPHVYHGRTSFVIVADSGHALIYDCAYVGKAADQLVEELERDMGLKQIDMIVVSHYHDDHIKGIPGFQDKYDAELWVHESLLDVLQNPHRYNIPCLWRDKGTESGGLKVDRVLKEGETFEWEGYKFRVFHLPGQTEYHMGMYAEIDGHRMLFMGDSTYRPAPGTPFKGANYNSRNYCRLGEGTGYLKCAEILKKYNPDMAMSAHAGAIPLDEKRIDEYYQWAKKLEPTFSKLIARDDPNFGIDRNWLSFYPYRVFSEAGETVETEVRIRNHSDHSARAAISPVLPEGWRAEPPELAIQIPPKETGKAKFTIVLPKDNPIPLRSVVTANVVFDGTDFGEFPEMVIDKRSEKDQWDVWLQEFIKRLRDEALARQASPTAPKTSR